MAVQRDKFTGRNFDGFDPLQRQPIAERELRGHREQRRRRRDERRDILDRFHVATNYFDRILADV